MIFARELGMLRVLAKGAKRPKAAYSGGLEMLTAGRIGVIVRPTSELALLTEWELEQPFSHLRTSLACHRAGVYVADVLQNVVRDHDPHPGLFDVSLATLDALKADVEVAEALLRFQWGVLVEAGFRPVLEIESAIEDADHAKGAVGAEGALVFDPEAGGVVKRGDGKGGEQEARGWRVRAATVDVLRELAAGTLAPGCEAQSVDRANRLLASYLRHVLGTEPASMLLVFPTGLSR